MLSQSNRSEYGSKNYSDHDEPKFSKTLLSLEWDTLTKYLARYAATDEGRNICLNWAPTLSEEHIRERWDFLSHLSTLIKNRCLLILEAVADVEPIVRAAGLGQILDGSDFQSIQVLLKSVDVAHSYAVSYESSCPPLKKYRAGLYPLPSLTRAIDRAIGPEGEVKDDASPELMRLRKQRLGLRKRIEDKLTKMIHGQEMEAYLQDEFFTLRADRYVVPLKLDARGRISGNIIDTSSSGQTLFCEPTGIANMNQELLEVELAQKLEVIRILKDLSQAVAQEQEILQYNYESLVELDVAYAQAYLSSLYDGMAPELISVPSLELKGARHPLLLLQRREQQAHDPESAKSSVIGNDISLKEDQRTLILSGPNAGGKTVILKTTGLLHVMAKAGLLLPVEEGSQIFPFEKIYLEMGDAQNLAANLSTFTGHLMGVKPIIEKATSRDLVLLDELAVGTEPLTGAAIARTFLETLTERGVVTLATTHYDRLKILAMEEKMYRCAGMEFDIKSYKPTYRILMDRPGESFGLEVAEQLGFSKKIIQRAAELRSPTMTQMDRILKSLSEKESSLMNEKQEYQQLRLQAEEEKNRWQMEKKAIQEVREQTAQRLIRRWESDLDELRDLCLEMKRKSGRMMREVEDSLQKKGFQELQETAENLGQRGRDLRQQMEVMAAPTQAPLPGQAMKAEYLKEGLKVFVLPLKKEGEVSKVIEDSQGSQDPHVTVEVQVGLLKLKLPIHDLRILNEEFLDAKKETSKKELKSDFKKVSEQKGETKTASGLSPLIQTPANTLDLRGQEKEDALQAMWSFIDKSLLRGEAGIILIHGHGTQVLKNAIRHDLETKSPYRLTYRPGERSQGGDGVTVVIFQ